MTVLASARLKAERLRVGGGRDALCVHNYGHGDVGWILAWGCADDVVALVKGHTQE
jgi:D-amino-acid oxidase